MEIPGQMCEMVIPGQTGQTGQTDQSLELTGLGQTETRPSENGTGNGAAAHDLDLAIFMRRNYLGNEGRGKVRVTILRIGKCGTQASVQVTSEPVSFLLTPWDPLTCQRVAWEFKYLSAAFDCSSRILK